MLIFDQLKKNDPHVRLLAIAVFSGLGLLLVGLWWVQVVRGRYYETRLENQSYRTVRVPAPRGRILDRNRIPLAENQPTFNLNLYLEELSPVFQSNFTAQLAAYRQAKQKLTRSQRTALARYARYNVASNVVSRVGNKLNLNLQLEADTFQRHYEQDLALPLPILSNLDPLQVAKLEEAADLSASLDLDIQPMRLYPNGLSAAHILGYVRRDDRSVTGEEAFFNHRLPDYRGIVGVEAAFDTELRGSAGSKAVLVNNLGYRQSENIITPVEPGSNVVLAIDLPIQQAAQKALQVFGPTTRGAAVVMDVRSGDVLAMASSPYFDPNDFVQGISKEQWARLNDEQLRPQINRCTQENYAPGSIFKIVVALAALEAGLNPNESYYVQPDPENPSKGCFIKGKIKKKDTAPPGHYDFKRAFIHSSNAYFIDCGLRAGIKSIVAVGDRLHLGERTGLTTRQEVKGYFPDVNRVSYAWSDGNTANTCIGQDPVLVTPLQMAVMTAAIANGGKVLWPRIVDRIEPLETVPGQQAVVYPRGQVRDQLGISARSLDILRAAMLADVEDSEGTGIAARIPGFRVCGKTGTAQVMNERNQVTDHTTWFASYAPFENPRYAVVVMVEGGGSGGGTCAPIAREIYLAIQKREVQWKNPAGTTLASNETR